MLQVIANSNYYLGHGWNLAIAIKDVIKIYLSNWVLLVADGDINIFWYWSHLFINSIL